MKTNSLVGKKCFGMVLRGKETINIDSIDELSYLRSKYEKNKKMNLICPSPKSFSDSIKNILSKDSM